MTENFPFSCGSYFYLIAELNVFQRLFNKLGSNGSGPVNTKAKPVLSKSCSNFAAQFPEKNPSKENIQKVFLESKSTQTLDNQASNQKIVKRSNSNPGTRTLRQKKNEKNIYNDQMYSKMMPCCSCCSTCCSSIPIHPNLIPWQNYSEMCYDGRLLCPSCIDPNCEHCVASLSNQCCTGFISDYNYIHPPPKYPRLPQQQTITPSTQTLQSLGTHPKSSLKLSHKDARMVADRENRKNHNPVQIQTNVLYNDEHERYSPEISNQVKHVNNHLKKMSPFHEKSCEELVDSLPTAKSDPYKHIKQHNVHFSTDQEPRSCEKDLNYRKNEEANLIVDNSFNVKIEIGSTNSNVESSSSSSSRSSSQTPTVTLNKTMSSDPQLILGHNSVNKLTNIKTTTSTTTTSTTHVNGLNNNSLEERGPVVTTSTLRCNLSLNNEDQSLETTCQTSNQHEIEPTIRKTFNKSQTLKKPATITYNDYIRNRNNFKDLLDLQHVKAGMDHLSYMSPIRQKVAQAKAAFFSIPTKQNTNKIN